jgi:hypothetical protein
MTLVHELGHHIHNILEQVDIEMYLSTMRANRLAGGTLYAQKSRREYFAESFALYVYQHEALLGRDPSGYGMIESALKRLELEVNPL